MSKQEVESSIQLRVSGSSQVTSVAGSIVKNLAEGKKVSLSAIGAGAVNQMVKALCVARSMAASSGIDLYFSVGFGMELIEGEEKTSIRAFVRTS